MKGLCELDETSEGPFAVSTVLLIFKEMVFMLKML